MRIQVGSVDDSSELHSPEYHYDNLLKIIRDSLCGRLSSSNFDVLASESDGNIIFTANLYRRKGRDLNNVALIEGHNLEDGTKLNEQGPIVNRWDMAGEGNDWGSGRITANATDTDSNALYDLRQGAQVFSDVSIQTTLNAHATTALAESKDPHKILELEAGDLRDPATNDPLPGGFASYGVGDSVRVILPSYGFGGLDTTVRILTREFAPTTGTCKLVVRIEE